MKAVMRTVLVCLLATGISSGSAQAKTLVKTKQYSIGFALDNSDCDFGEKYELPDEFSAIVTVKTITRYLKKKTLVKYSVFRTGKFPFRVIFKKIKVSKRGFSATGTKTMGTKILSETLKVENDGGLMGTNTMRITEAGSRCTYSYSGDATGISN